MSAQQHGKAPPTQPSGGRTETAASLRSTPIGEQEVRRALESDLHIPLYLARVRDAAERAGLEIDSTGIWNLVDNGLEKQLQRDWERMKVRVTDGVVSVCGRAVGTWERRAVSALAGDIPGVRAVVQQ